MFFNKGSKGEAEEPLAAGETDGTGKLSKRQEKLQKRSEKRGPQTKVSRR